MTRRGFLALLGTACFFPAESLRGLVRGTTVRKIPREILERRKLRMRWSFDAHGDIERTLDMPPAMEEELMRGMANQIYRELELMGAYHMPGETGA